MTISEIDYDMYNDTERCPRCGCIFLYEYEVDPDELVKECEDCGEIIA